MMWTLITAVNNESTLRQCLLASPCVVRAQQVLVLRGAKSAGIAYNEGLALAASEICVFAHQDVYLPEAWDEKLKVCLETLEAADSNWAVLGVFGIRRATQEPVGHVYCTGLGRALGRPFGNPVEAGTLDELVLVLRRSASVRFDEQLPGFHLYGTDICLTAQERGLKCYVIQAFCIHNTEGRIFLPVAFWKAFLYMRRKWWSRLPVRTPCVRITRSGTDIVGHSLRSAYARYVKGEKPGRRMEDPSRLITMLGH